MRIFLTVSLVAGLAAAQPSALDAFVGAPPACDPERTYCLAIQLHVASGDAGPVITPAWFATQLATANRHFAPIGVGFQLASADAASTPHVATRAQRTALARHATGRTIHVFVTGRLDDVDVPGDEIRGVAWRKDGRKYVILSAQAPARVLAHELGHVFGLPHSSHAISIMNKTHRDAPPPEERTFAPEELAAMAPVVRRLVRGRALANLAVAR